MIPQTSSIVRNLTQSEIDTLVSEMNNNAGLWSKHPMHSTALDDGKSIILNWVTRINGNYQLQWTFREHFPNTWKILESIADGRQFGKIYWHLLEPGRQAKPHTDIVNPYIIDGNADKRYNIFLNMPTGIELMFDGLKTPMPNTQSLEYTLFDMAANTVHSVRNPTNENFYAMIIDILNPGVLVYEDLYSINYVNAPGGKRLSR
jgi:hypothetical protein